MFAHDGVPVSHLWHLRIFWEIFVWFHFQSPLNLHHLTLLLGKSVKRELLLSYSYAIFPSSFLRTARKASLCTSQVATAVLPLFPSHWYTGLSSVSWWLSFSLTLHYFLLMQNPQWLSIRSLEVRGSHPQCFFSSTLLPLQSLQSPSCRAEGITNYGFTKRWTGQPWIPIWNIFNVCLLGKHSI